jgi:DNA-binding response OmpR family regulator
VARSLKSDIYPYDHPMTRVLLAEDDPAISEPLARALRREGYDVDVRADGRAALDAATENPDLVVLDLGLPHVDGLEVCRRIRAEGRSVPVLILTARADEVDTVVGLDAGADDYVTKPFRLAELLARVRALLRRNPADAAPSNELVRIDPEGRRAWFKDEELQLTAKEFDLLRVLVREQGKVVSREQLMREIWETAWFGSTKTLDMHISVLRRKLGDDAAQPRYIATVRGVGFRFERGDGV